MLRLPLPGLLLLLSARDRHGYRFWITNGPRMSLLSETLRAKNHWLVTFVFVSHAFFRSSGLRQKRCAQFLYQRPHQYPRCFCIQFFSSNSTIPQEVMQIGQNLTWCFFWLFSFLETVHLVLHLFLPFYLVMFRYTCILMISQGEKIRSMQFRRVEDFCFTGCFIK